MSMSAPANAAVYSHASPMHTRLASGKRRKAPRAVLACKFCRQRKAKCSGDWPSCIACVRRNQECVYPGHLPSASIIAAGARSNRPTASDVQVIANQSGTEFVGLDINLPSESLRKKAISYFREHYASTLLCFIPPQQLIEDEVGDNLALPLLLSILALVSRSIPEFADDSRSLTEVSDEFAELARRELDQISDAPSLVGVQCALILCIYEIGEGSEHRGWLRLGWAARSTQLLQLHRQDSSPNQLDWGNLAPPNSSTLAEVRRRTFWCCFCLERLLANGRDRIAVFLAEDITTRLPLSDEDFIYGRQKLSGTLVSSNSSNANNSNSNCKEPDSLFAYTIRIIDILAKVMTWHGRGGRHMDARAPWLPDMPFAILDESLQQWKAAIPSYLDYTPQNTTAVIAAGHGRLWTLMFMVYFQARAYLHREYLPFTPHKDYDPRKGPCDGPVLILSNTPPPEDFWYRSTLTMIESANAISDLYHVMKIRGLSASAYPIPGLGLFTAASIHVLFSIFCWQSMLEVVNESSSRHYLKQDMEALNDIGQRWSLAVHWIRQVSLYYKLNIVTRRSWIDAQYNLSSMKVKEIKDGIMNYVRQISQQDRETRDVNLRETFDFPGWLAVLERSVSEDVSNTPVTQLSTLEPPHMVSNEINVDISQSTEYESNMPWFSDMDGLAAIPSQAPWMFTGDNGWSFDS
ncbi:fungal-specific transcription factor domain-containing protein [Xylariales sp. PMI_506]|nr:fungal-specific transcription factor domain-containing protein [Xylariales sp. PMI_506]